MAPSARTGIARRPNVYTIPPGRPFLACLARAVLDGHLPHPGGKPLDDLGTATILLPTRRATRALQEEFLEASAGRAMLLPRIKPIAEGNEDLALLTSMSGPEAMSAGDADIPPAIPEITRRIVMTGLVKRWSEAMQRTAIGADEASDEALVAASGAGTAAQAAALATELARLIDEVETEEIDLSGLAGLVPDRFAAHWEKTLDFLKIVLEWWPAELAERKLLSPMDRRNRLVRAEAKRLAENPPAGPVIVAGVTGSIPATAELMRVVSRLPEGAIVIPGLDQMLDDASWAAISAPSARTAPVPDLFALAARREAASVDGTAEPHPEHPQHGLKRLIDALGIAREDVRLLPGADVPPLLAARNRLISEALRPARTTGRWHEYTVNADPAEIRAALENCSLIEAASEEDEAEAISLMLREVAETPGRTAALVSRDRLLARRVAIRLEAWGIRVDDSAGRPLAKTMPGSFLDLVVEAAATDFTPASLVAALETSSDPPRPLRRHRPPHRARARDRRLPHALSRTGHRRCRRSPRSRRARCPQSRSARAGCRAYPRRRLGGPEGVRRRSRVRVRASDTTPRSPPPAGTRSTRESPR